MDNNDQERHIQALVGTALFVMPVSATLMFRLEFLVVIAASIVSLVVLLLGWYQQWSLLRRRFPLIFVPVLAHCVIAVWLKFSNLDESLLMLYVAISTLGMYWYLALLIKDRSSNIS